MPIEDARKFMDRTEQDESFRKTARERHDDIVNVGRENGYHFTEDEIRQAVHERKGKPGYEDDDPDICTCLICCAP